MTIMNIFPEIPLVPWILDYARKLSCAPTPGVYLWKGERLNGFYLKTSTNYELFCVSEEDRETVGAKYLLPSGKGVQPSLHVPNQGVIQNLDGGATPELLYLCKTEGIGVVEGWKSALYLAALGFVAVHTGGYSCGVATIEKLENWEIPPTYVKYVFADSDLLTNPSVAQSYFALLKLCPNAQLFVNIETFFDKDGILRESKSSPDDWISSGDTKEMVLQKVRQIPIEWLISCHQNIAQRIYFENLYKENATLQARAWLNQKLKNYYVMYESSSTQELYVYSDWGYWESFNKQTFLEKILSENSPAKIPWSYATLKGALKILVTEYIQKSHRIQDLFSQQRYIGFENGTWDRETQQLLPHSPQHYLRGLLPFEKIEVPSQISVQQLCPKIVQWICDRANGIEIYVNILIAFLLLVILDTRNLERFLFLSGYSATGKSTFLKLLQKFVPPYRQHVSTAENLTSQFGDLSGSPKQLILFQNLGDSVSSHFVNLLRNLISSGETQNVQRKYESTTSFEGLVVAASNKNPFSRQQREGIVDRRMIYVPFVNRIPPKNLQEFDSLFPQEELENFASFALQQDEGLLKEFLRISNQVPLVKESLMESMTSNKTYHFFLKFLLQKVNYSFKSWIPYGHPDDLPNSLGQQPSSIYQSYLTYLRDHAIGEKMDFVAFRQECLPTIHSLFPHWDIVERRRLHKSDQKKVGGILNISLDQQKPSPSDDSVDFSRYSSEPFWVFLEEEEVEQATMSDHERPQATTG